MSKELIARLRARKVKHVEYITTRRTPRTNHESIHREDNETNTD